MLGQAGEPQPTEGLLQAAWDEKQEEDVVGGVRRRPEVTADDAGMDMDMEVCCARRVSRARPGLDALWATIVDPDSQEKEEEMESPRWARPPSQCERGEK